MFNTKPDRPNDRFLLEIEHNRHQSMKNDDDNYYVGRIDSRDVGGKWYSFSKLQVMKYEYVDWVQKWYQYYRSYRLQHPIKYRRAKRLWVKYRPQRP